MPVISVSIQKGGSGKTTTAINLAAALRQLKYKVLLIDLDPQSNLTQALGMHPDQEPEGKEAEKKPTVYELLKNEASGEPAETASAIVETNGMDLIPATLELSLAEWELISAYGRENLFSSILEPVRSNYDFIIVDCPPTLGILTVNALMASDYVLIPMQAEFLPLKGFEGFMESSQRMFRLNKSLQILGILITRYDPRHSMTESVIRRMEERQGARMFNTRIRINVALAKAQEKGVDIFTYDEYSNGAINYMALAYEVLNRLRENEKTANP